MLPRKMQTGKDMYLCIGVTLGEASPDIAILGKTGKF